jgi:heme/copper-type cytochrome/quinol oxidase subunit 2
MMILKKISGQVKNVISALFFSVISFISFAQTPTHIPRQQPEPVGFFDSVENIVFYVVIPVLIVILYFLWKNQLKKQRKEQEDRAKEQD